MAFDFDQPSYVAFRKVLAERTRQVVVICGAGLSRSAGLPGWVELKSRLLLAAKKEVQYRNETRKRDEALIEAAENEADFWTAFRFLRMAMLETSYTAEIRSAFASAATAVPPEEYVDLWRLPLGGFVTLNLDGFVGRAFAERFGGAREVRQFSGIDCDRHTDLFTSGKEFVVNLHGVLSEVKSWVFTADDLESLMKIQAYQQFLGTLFTSRTVLFVGVTADDPAVSRHLERLRAIGFSGGDHFWITHRADAATVRWAQTHQVRIIYYSSEDHSDVRTIVKDINRWVPREAEPPPVLPSTSKQRGFVLPQPEEIERLGAEEIRQALNKEASRILNSGNPDRESKYADFWTKYSEAIHRAWSVTSAPPRNIFMGFKVTAPLTKGGFGSIYDAERNDGDRVAIKVLHNVAKDDHATLVSFRRGVRAMRILSERKVDGMVPYEAAWEIPPCAVMKFVDGPNLQQAVEANAIDNWELRLKVATQLTEIIQSAHAVPEAVLHRDIRPANIMLSDLWSDPDDFRVVVLDFDLSWHRDAVGHSVSLAHSFNGYLAPELTGDSEYSPRNALVDSYGIGMTLFYLVAKRAPLLAESQFGDWKDRLKREVGDQIADRWKSMSRRWARLVFWATRPAQNERWDVGRILGELRLLRTAWSTPSQSNSAELAAEEMLARTHEGARSYEWDVDRTCGSFEIRTGFHVVIRADESNKRIELVCEWMNTGDRKFENVKKYIGPAAERAGAFLERGGWGGIIRNVMTDNIRVTASVDLVRFRGSGALDRAVAAINEAVEGLKLGNA